MWQQLVIVTALCALVAGIAACSEATPGAPPAASQSATATPPAPSTTSSVATPASPASSAVTAGGIVSVTGHAMYELSPSEFVFSDGGNTYTITMDESTRCVNLNGKLLGGSKFISRIIMVTSLPITITGVIDGTTIRASSVLIPTTKDAIT